MMRLPIRVGIALVRRGGCYLIRQRPPVPGSPMPGYWEFPGGKCDEGESPAQAAVRECWEEARVRVVPGPRRRAIVHEYPHGLVELNYFDCALEDPHSEPAPDSGFLWVPAGDLPAYVFPQANEPVVDQLAREARDHEPRP